jgi:ribonuclease BN (tRNA processing enzyme)
VRLTTIGTGTAAPSPSRVCAGLLVEAGADRILVDCGSGVVHRMAMLDIDWMGITHIALTHFHNDHISDLGTLFYAWRYGAIPWRQNPIIVIGPPATGDLMARIDAVCGGALGTFGYRIEVTELAPGDRLDLAGGSRITSRKVPHTAESVAYSIERDGRRVVYTGDMGRDEGLAEWAARCDALVAECSLPAAMRVESHLTPEDCAELAASASPGELILTHFYPPVERIDIRAIVAARYAGPVVLAHDGWSKMWDDGEQEIV